MQQYPFWLHCQQAMSNKEDLCTISCSGSCAVSCYQGQCHDDGAVFPENALMVQHWAKQMLKGAGLT